MPERIQLSRAKGWRKPVGAVVVARPSKWGNPYMIATGCQSSETANRMIVVALFRRELVAALVDPWGSAHTIEFRRIAESLEELRGRAVACWCPLDQVCHGDVLLELANRPNDSNTDS